MIVGWILFAFGASVCLFNVYTSWIRYPLHRLRGRSAETFRWVSGIPVVGSITLVVAWAIWIRHSDSTLLDVAVWALAIADTGGLHWFAGVMLYQSVAAHRQRRRGS